jgi:uncharacterized tellurite resistance protein B-like protein
MRVLATLQTFFSVQQAKRWPIDDRRALLRLFYDVVTADGIVSADELQAIEEAAHTYGVPLSDVISLGIGWAMGELSKDPAKLKTACLLAAHVFFKDGDLDSAEQRFVDELSAKYQIPDNILKSTIESLRKEKLDEALKAIYDEAFGPGAPAPHEATPIEPDAHRRDVDDL